MSGDDRDTVFLTIAQQRVMDRALRRSARIVRRWPAMLATWTEEEALARHRPSEHAASCSYHVDQNLFECDCGVMATTCKRCGRLRDPLVRCEREGCE